MSDTVSGKVALETKMEQLSFQQ